MQKTKTNEGINHALLIVCEVSYSYVVREWPKESFPNFPNRYIVTSLCSLLKVESYRIARPLFRYC